MMLLIFHFRYSELATKPNLECLRREICHSFILNRLKYNTDFPQAHQQIHCPDAAALPAQDNKVIHYPGSCFCVDFTYL